MVLMIVLMLAMSLLLNFSYLKQREVRAQSWQIRSLEYRLSVLADHVNKGKQSEDDRQYNLW